MICTTCKIVYPESCMIKKTCYLCTLAKFPPKTSKQLKNYKKAVGIRLKLVTPLHTNAQVNKIINTVGLDDLGYLQQIIDGKIVSIKPEATFYIRLVKYLT